MHFVILSLNPGYDRWAMIEKPSALPAVTRASRAFSLPGGKGIDVARCLHALGHEDYRCFTFLGGHQGDEIARACREEGLNMESVRIAGESRLNHTSVYLYRNETFTVNEEGPSVTREETESLIRKVKLALDKSPGSVLTICGTACPGFTPDDFCVLADYASRTGHETAIDIGGANLVPLSHTAPSLLKINRQEFLHAFGFDGWKRTPHVSSWIRENRIPVLILTDGAAGSCTHTSDTSLYAELPEGCGGPYGVGCGDAFFGGYLSAWSECLPMDDRIRRANACGISNSRALRCGSVDAGEVSALQDRILIYPCR